MSLRARATGPLLALALLAACGATSTRPPTLSPARGRPIALTISRLGGGTLDLAALRGKVVVLTLFTTWSLRSQAEASRFNQLAARYRSEDVAVVAVALHRRGHALVKTYVDFVGLRFAVGVVDPEDLRLVSALGLTKRVPRTLLLDRSGRRRQDHVAGQTDFPRLLEGIAQLLARSDRRAPSPTPAPSGP